MSAHGATEAESCCIAMSILDAWGYSTRFGGHSAAGPTLHPSRSERKAPRKTLCQGHVVSRMVMVAKRAQLARCRSLDRPLTSFRIPFGNVSRDGRKLSLAQLTPKTRNR
jgi:hypothetical protein